jgi:hypothetical protein
LAWLAPGHEEIILLNEESKLVSIEQLGVWIETKRWLKHAAATQVGFEAKTLAEIMNKHAEGAIELSALVDGKRRKLSSEEQRDYHFQISWEMIAGLFRTGSRGNVRVQGRSIKTYLPSKLYYPICRSTTLIHSPASGSGEQGYHILVEDILLERELAIKVWPPDRRPSPEKVNEDDLILDELLCRAWAGGGPRDKPQLFEAVRTVLDPRRLGDDEVGELLLRICPEFLQQCCEPRPVPGEKIPCAERVDDIESSNRYVGANEHGQKRIRWEHIVDTLLVTLKGNRSPKSPNELARMIWDFVGGEEEPSKTAILGNFKPRFPNLMRLTQGDPIQ